MPINAMGMSKSMMEKLAQSAAREIGSDASTTLSCVRYGNVMYSRGSVIPLHTHSSENTGDGELITVHREANVDNSKRLSSLVGALNALAEKYDCPVIVSTHPRTRKRLDALTSLVLHDRVQYMKPFGFRDYNHLQLHAKCAISDSGTIAEESSILGFPAVTPRDVIERPEAIDIGAIVFFGLEEDNMIRSVRLAIDCFADNHQRGRECNLPLGYDITNTSERVVKLIQGSAMLPNSWDGIH